MDYYRLNLLLKENEGVKFPNIDLGNDIFHYNPKIINDKSNLYIQRWYQTKNMHPCIMCNRGSNQHTEEKICKCVTFPYASWAISEDVI